MKNFDFITYLYISCFVIIFILLLCFCYLAIKKGLEKLGVKIKVNLYESKDILLNSSKDSLKEILLPFQNEINRLQQRSNEIHSIQTRQVSELQGRLSSMLEVQNKLSYETDKLTNALRGNIKIQGNLGESILERVLENSGLKEGINYSKQNKYSTEIGYKQPDFIIKLPENRDIIIDSKMSLNSYIDYNNSNQEVDKKLFLHEMKKSFEKHIKSLASKDYSNINNLNSIQAVLLFIPIESIYLILVENFPDLFLEASRHKIYVVTSISLMPLLQIIDHIWKVHSQDKNTRDMALIAGKIYDKFSGILNEFDNIKSSIGKLDKQIDILQNKFLGRDNIVKNVEKLKSLGANTNKSIPEKWIESSETVVTNKNNSIKGDCIE